MTTYYVVKQAPIFRHVIKYMFYKTERAEVSLDGLPGADGASSGWQIGSDPRACSGA